MAFLNSLAFDPSNLHKRSWLLACYVCRFPSDDPQQNQFMRNRMYDTWGACKLDMAIRLGRTLRWHEVVEAGVVAVRVVNLERQQHLLINICLQQQQPPSKHC